MKPLNVLLDTLRNVKFQVSATQSDYAAHKGEGYDPSDPGLRPSLLEEVLAQKKLVCKQVHGLKNHTDSDSGKIQFN